MAFRIQDSVVRGAIDNREKGIVRGSIWIHGRADPIGLELRGNAHPDLAGCLLTFTNRLPATAHPHLASLHSEQRGTIGDLTASRKVRVFDIPFEEAYDMIKRGEKPPEHIANSLYLEWFSERNGRVVIECSDYQIEISPPAWRLSSEEEQHRAQDAATGFAGFMNQISQALESARFKPPEDRPMTEFDWEKSFRESDALTHKAMELHEKFGDRSDFEEILAREMGWDKAEQDEPPDRGDDGVDVEELNRICQEAAANPPQPNPPTEGADWVREDDGCVSHPLEVRIRNGSVDFWNWCDERDLFGDDGDPDLHNMIFKYQNCGAKCAGALGGLAYEEDVRDPGGAFLNQ